MKHTSSYCVVLVVSKVENCIPRVMWEDIFNQFDKVVPGVSFDCLEECISGFEISLSISVN